MSDIVAVLPYVLPLLTVGLLLLLFQRFMPQTDKWRNLAVLVCVICFGSSFLLLFYAGLGSYWWMEGEHPTVGSWWYFVGALQWITDAVFGSVAGAIAYVVAVSTLMAFLMYRVISPPNPDFVALQQKLKESQDSLSGLRSEQQRLESENKKLNDMLVQRDEALKTMQSRLDSLSREMEEAKSVKERLEQQVRTSAESVAASKEAEFLETISTKDRTIGELQRQIEELKTALSSAKSSAPTGAPVPDSELATLRSRLNEIASRAETAVVVSESMAAEISRLRQVIDGARADEATKVPFRALISMLEKAVSDISAAAKVSSRTDPRVETIGMVMLAHEIIDGLRQAVRSL
ncbi:MAG: hypothetical protein QXS20_10585 [Candidatus Thorarchaeota archaeon]